MATGSLNKATLIGNLGKDPEVRHTKDGRAVVVLLVATSDAWKDRTTGEKRERTQFTRAVIYHNALCSIAEKHLRKGRPHLS